MSPSGSRMTSNEKNRPLFGPFRPNNPAKHGYNKTLNAYPTYIEEKDDKEDRDALREKYLLMKKKEKVWIPNTFEWSKPSVSINQHFRNASIERPQM
jgi:DNA-directed RNA polymerase beta' subunit